VTLPIELPKIVLCISVAHIEGCPWHAGPITVARLQAALATSWDNQAEGG
jgi:hypothetical protein